MSVNPSNSVTNDKEVQSAKAATPIVVALSGMLMLVSDVQPAKTLLPIDVTPLCHTILVNFVHPVNNPYLSIETPDGMVKDVSLVHEAKALLSISDTVDGISILVILLSANASSPILLKPLGKVILSKSDK